MDAIPVETTYLHACTHFFDDEKLSEPESKVGICVKALQAKNTKFVRLYRHRFYAGKCQVFLLMWPESEKHLSISVKYLAVFDQICQKQYIYQEVLFPTSYGQMYFVLFTEDIPFLVSHVRSRAIVPETTFIYHSSKSHFLGWKLAAGTRKVEFVYLKSKLLTHEFFLEFLGHTDRLDTIYFFDDALKIQNQH